MFSAVSRQSMNCIGRFKRRPGAKVTPHRYASQRQARVCSETGSRGQWPTKARPARATSDRWGDCRVSDNDGPAHKECGLICPMAYITMCTISCPCPILCSLLSKFQIIYVIISVIFNPEITLKLSLSCQNCDIVYDFVTVTVILYLTPIPKVYFPYVTACNLVESFNLARTVQVIRQKWSYMN